MPAMPVFHEDAPAKINLTLAITGRRGDGYHLLDSVVMFAAIGDKVSLRQAETDQLKITGAFADGLAGEPVFNNIVWQSLAAFRQHTGWAQPCSITLEKNLPVAAGIGGGSSDAAAMLRLLNRLAPRPLSDDALADMALGLGADVPVCLKADQGGFWRMRGIGEVIEPLPAPKHLGMILLNNGTKVATGDVFAAFGTPGEMKWSVPQPYPGPHDLAGLGRWITGGNDLLAPALEVAPAISRSLDILAGMKSFPGFIASGMSGSGATCFALFTGVDAASMALSSAGKIPGWSWAGGVCSIST